MRRGGGGSRAGAVPKTRLVQKSSEDGNVQVVLVLLMLFVGWMRLMWAITSVADWGCWREELRS